MRGFITELDFEVIDQCFPGIMRYYRELKEKPKTFLELMWRYTRCDEVSTVADASASEPEAH
jgi:hypothetical protein